MRRTRRKDHHLSGMNEKYLDFNGESGTLSKVANSASLAREVA